MIDRLTDRSPILLAAASALVLAAALAFQYLGGLAPCALCIWQRWPHLAAVLLAAAALAVRGRARVVLVALAGVAVLASAGIALFHVGVEQHWWQGLPSCSGGAIDYSSGSVADLRQQLLAQPVVRCDAVAWSLFGISMAGWNLLISLALGAAALAAALRIGRGSRS